jgi:hypothetical protein
MQAVRIIASLVGAIFGFYCGFTFLVPALIVLIVFFVTKYSVSTKLKPFTGTFAIQLGHGLWMFMGGLIISGAMKIVEVDLSVLVVGLILLLIWPGLVSVCYLGIYQIVALAINCIRISNYEFGTIGNKAIAVTIILRICAIVTLIVGYLQFRKALLASTSQPEIKNDSP